MARINSAVRKRKIMRYIYYFLILGLVSAAITVAAIYLHFQDTVTYDANTAINLKVDNCTMFIYDKTDSTVSSSDIYLQYRVPRGLDLGDGGSIAGPAGAKNPTLATFKSPFSGYINNCWLKIYVKPGT
jgi:hypothetical protein